MVQWKRCGYELWRRCNAECRLILMSFDKLLMILGRCVIVIMLITILISAATEYAFDFRNCYMGLWCTFWVIHLIRQIYLFIRRKWRWVSPCRNGLTFWIFWNIFAFEIIGINAAKNLKNPKLFLKKGLTKEFRCGIILYVEGTSRQTNKPDPKETVKIWWKSTKTMEA